VSEQSSVALAQRCAAAILAADPTAERLGIVLEEVAPGFARLALTV